MKTPRLHARALSHTSHRLSTPLFQKSSMPIAVGYNTRWRRTNHRAKSPPAGYHPNAPNRLCDPWRHRHETPRIISSPAPKTQYPIIFFFAPYPSKTSPHSITCHPYAKNILTTITLLPYNTPILPLREYDRATSSEASRPTSRSLLQTARLHRTWSRARGAARSGVSRVRGRGGPCVCAGASVCVCVCARLCAWACVRVCVCMRWRVCACMCACAGVRDARGRVRRVCA